MENKLQEFVEAFVKVAAQVESQKSYLADLEATQSNIADELSKMIHDAIGFNDETYLDYGDGILLCSDYDGEMSFQRIHTIDVDDLKSLKAE